MRLILLAAVASLPLAAQVCNPAALAGAYGFQLSGTTTIGDKPQPMASLGRLVFDGSGHLSGTSSVNFNGYFLGNPVTGVYELKTDCSLTWSLQDDSGGWQHFRGTAQPGLASATFRQTDTGTSGSGTLRRTASTCTAAAMRGPYLFRMGAMTTPFSTQARQTPSTMRTVTVADGNGGLSWKSGEAVNTGTYTVDSDCFVKIDFGFALRGIVVEDGRTVLAVQTDPTQVGVATFSAQ
jgi:hypothetical protein